MKSLDDRLKQRLVGALVLVILAIIFLPVLFDREPLDLLDTQTQIPPAPKMVAVEVAAPQEPPSVQPAPSPADMYLADESKAVSDEPEAPSLKADGTPKGWVLQVASVRDKTKAKQLHQTLVDKGYPAYLRDGNFKNDPVIRVFVGPKLDKQALVKDKLILDKLLNVNALILPFGPNP